MEPRRVGAHGRHMLGNVSFACNTSKFFQDEIEYPFFLYHLKGKGDGNKLPEAYVFETGRNEWHKLDAWPPKTGHGQDALLPAGRQAGGRSAPEAAGEAFDEYVSDPNEAGALLVPYIDGSMNYNYMTDDQRFASGAAGRAGVPDRSRWRRTSPWRGR